jgi:phosphoribosylaminoimidazole-succinocarboxamide synthase
MTTAQKQARTQIDLPDVPRVRGGKVREVFDLGDRYLFVTTDRISAFDCILPSGIPGKGHVLNQLSAFWFELLGHVINNHLLSTDPDEYPEILRQSKDALTGRSMIVRKMDMLPVECVARGYLAGSAWKEYRDQGTLAGEPLPTGYRQSCRLPEPLFSPATKAESGHDINIPFGELENRFGADLAAQLQEVTLRLYREAADYALDRGIVIADTKFEFGLLDGELMLADEALTPDSSRFWPKDQVTLDTSPPSFDKQFVRDYLDGLNWNKKPPAPALPTDIALKTREKYLQAFELLTGSAPVE